ncbi:choice-of-anchor O protein [Tautonia sp. JC769]|uniref:choice-of-anchor O protein n=1 Tax=Tautonia sp. JC769 TaxID=3232135 RepID=UPI0034597AFB
MVSIVPLAAEYGPSRTDLLNVSETPEFLTEKSKIDVMPSYVQSRSADGELLAGTVKPLIVTYTDEVAGTGASDTIVAISLDDGATWKHFNLSRSATESSFDLADGQAAYGDTVKPVIQVAGRNLFVAWTSKYAPLETPDSVSPAYGRTDSFGVAGEQGSVDYAAEGRPDLGEVPFSAVWVARGMINLDGTVDWLRAEQVTSGVRDAIQVNISGAGQAGFAVSWQEDPEGLRPGEGLGPGDGLSGALVSDGTDIWYSSIRWDDFLKKDPAVDPGADPHGRAKALVPMSSPVRVTNNDGGRTGASRPNMFLQPLRDSTGKVIGAETILGYEETKGGGDTGKSVFYHHFPDFTDPDTIDEGDLLSDPGLNARRVRFVLQPKAQAGDSGTVLAALYRQSEGGHDSPADIFMRRALGDYTFASFQSEVNVSSAGLDDGWDADPDDNARAHRGIMRGDFMMLGYTLTTDWAAAQVGEDHYDFFVRRSFDGGVTWEESRNLSNLPDHTMSVIEPRIVGTPGTITKLDGPPTGNPEDLQNPDVIFVSYGTAFDTPGGDEDEDSDSKNAADIFYSRTTDRGDTYELVYDAATGAWGFAPLAEGPASQAEAQLRTTPSGTRLYAVWNQNGLDPATGIEGSDSWFARIEFAPTISAPADQSARERIAGVVDLGTLVDPGDDGPWTVVIDWGDGTSDTVVVDEAGPIGLRSHRYLTAGSFEVTLSAADDDGVEGPSSSFRVAVTPTPATPGDMDRDGLTDLVDYTSDAATGGRFEVRQTSDGTAHLAPLGAMGDIPVHGDFDGDGIIDLAIFRPDVDSNGDGVADAAGWTIVESSTGSTREVLFGAPGMMDMPVAADFDGDGIADIATFRASSDLTPGAAEWFILPSSTGLAYRFAFGAANLMDLPAPADFDGDGKADIATFRPDSDLTPGAAEWFILPSSTGLMDLPAPADFDGDGKADIATYRPVSDLLAGSAHWFVVPSSTHLGYAEALGEAGDVAAPGDYDGDGRIDLATFRQGSSTWTIRESATGDDRAELFGTDGPRTVPLVSPLVSRLAATGHALGIGTATAARLAGVSGPSTLLQALDEALEELDRLRWN